MTSLIGAPHGESLRMLFNAAEIEGTYEECCEIERYFVNYADYAAEDIIELWWWLQDELDFKADWNTIDDEGFDLWWLRTESF